jgi:uncharacterized protein (TIGR03118 family)
MRTYSLRNWNRSALVSRSRAQTAAPRQVGLPPRLEPLDRRCLLSSSAIVQTNLVSDDTQFTPAQHQDPHLVNPWGLAASPHGEWWVANEGTGTSTLYDTSGPQVSVIPAVFIVPGAPTGTVFNGSAGIFRGDAFLFASADGTISGWKPSYGLNAAVEASHTGALYLGLATATNSQNASLMYAADFANGNIDVYDQNFQPVTNLPGNFTDSKLPDDYHPFNIQAINNQLYVEYAPLSSILAGTAKTSEGAIDVYNADGQLQQRLIKHGVLNQPWAIAMAPSNFGRFSNDLLVGNFGDGHINAFDPTNGHFAGQLKDADGRPITIRHLWGLSFGNGGAAGPTNTLYFTAGLTSHLAPGDDPFHGLFGSLEIASAPARAQAPAPARFAMAINRDAQGSFWMDKADLDALDATIVSEL